LAYSNEDLDMEVQTISARQFNAEIEPDTAERYFGEINLKIISEYQALEAEKQVIDLHILIAHDGSIDSDYMQSESRFKSGAHYPFYTTELTTEQFEQYTNLELVKQAIAKFGESYE
jgi:hypothetical protein